MAKKKEPAPPSKFSQDLFDQICDEIAEGKSIRSICLRDDRPAHKTFFAWLNKDEALAAQYARAREDQADTIFDECLEIADAAKPEDVQAARLRIDTRKWMAGKLRPKNYGEKVDLTSSDGSMTPVTNIVNQLVQPKKDGPDA